MSVAVTVRLFFSLTLVEDGDEADMSAYYGAEHLLRLFGRSI